MIPALLWLGGVLGVGASLYGLHRLGLWLEARGLLYYWHKKPESSPASCLAAMERVLVPQSHHAIEVKEQKRPVREVDGDLADKT